MALFSLMMAMKSMLPDALTVLDPLFFVKNLEMQMLHVLSRCLRRIIGVLWSEIISTKEKLRKKETGASVKEFARRDFGSEN